MRRRGCNGLCCEIDEGPRLAARGRNRRVVGGVDGDGRARRDDRRRAGQGLSQQPRHQSATRRRARAGRKRPQGELRLSAQHFRRRRRRALADGRGLGPAGSAKYDDDAARLRPDGDAERVERRPHRQFGASGRIGGVRRARAIAQHRAERAAQRRRLLHGRAARHGDPRSRPQQRRSAAGAVAPDPGPLQRRRSDAHRRRAGRGEPRRRARHRARRAVAVAGVAGQLSPGDRRRSEEPVAGRAAFAPVAEGAARGDRGLAARTSGDRRDAARRRRRGVAGEDRRRRALSDGRRHRAAAEALRLQRALSASSCSRPRSSARSRCRSTTAA